MLYCILLAKLPASESTSKQAFLYSEVKTSNIVFLKSSAWRIEQGHHESNGDMTKIQDGGLCKFRTPGTLPMRQSGVSPGACQSPIG